MKISAARFVLVTSGLLATGFVCGGLLGATVAFAESFARYGPRTPPDARGVIGFGALFGAFLGALLVPGLAWTFLRRVPMGRAILETGGGALAGVLVSTLLAPTHAAFGAIVGFLAAGIRLFVVARASRGNSLAASSGAP